MFSRFQISALTLTLTTGLIAAGCGSSASLSPTGPSMGTSSSGAATSDLLVDASEAAAPAGKGGQGRVDADHGPQGDKDKDKNKEGDRDKGKGVEANGRITSIAAATRTLVIGTHQVSVPTTATIRHGSRTLAFTDLKVGDHVQVKGTLNATLLVASEVKVEQGGGNDDAEDEDEDDDKDRGLKAVKLSGAVSLRAGTCPALTFTVGTTKVSTTASTKFGDITCQTLADATVVKVKGARQADGSVVATHVSVDDESEDDDLNESELSGAVSARAGTCPTLTFTVGTTKVATSASTTFRDITCATLADATVVEVKGTRQADGSIVATRVSLED